MAYRDIRDYAAIGDCHGGALVSADGRVDWCALARIDDAPVCCRLLDDALGGYLHTRSVRRAQTRRRYLPGTNILETKIGTATGSATFTDFMPLGPGPGGGDVSPDARHWLVRRIDVEQGEVAFDFAFRPCVDWCLGKTKLSEAEHGLAWEGGQLLCDRAVEIDMSGSGAKATWCLKRGERVRVLISSRPLHDADAALASVDALLDATSAYWSRWSARCRYEGRYATAVMRSALALKLLTRAPSGAIAAALTTSLPEHVGGSRNWDYRLCWVRDSTLTLFALAAIGYVGEAERFSDFLFATAAGDDMFPTQIVYGVEGETSLGERDLPHLDGYRGSRPVRIGNAAHRQRQFDVYGEMLDWAYLRQRLGASFDRERLDLLKSTADYVAAHWSEPGQGIWEMRGPPRQHVFSKIMSWVALDRADRLAGREDYREAKAEIEAEIRARGIARGGYLRQTFDQDHVDASLLRAPIVDFPLPPGTLEATVEAVIARLAVGDIVFRYDGVDGLEGEEGAFLACGFWLVDAMLFLGRVDEARERFEALLSRANDVGLFSEEIDASTNAFLGNFPQAFTHLALIHSATLFEIVEQQGSGALRGTHADRVRRAMHAIESS